MSFQLEDYKEDKRKHHDHIVINGQRHTWPCETKDEHCILNSPMEGCWYNYKRHRFQVLRQKDHREEQLHQTKQASSQRNLFDKYMALATGFKHSKSKETAMT